MWSVFSVSTLRAQLKAEAYGEERNANSVPYAARLVFRMRYGNNPGNRNSSKTAGFATTGRENSERTRAAAEINGANCVLYSTW